MGKAPKGKSHQSRKAGEPSGGNGNGRGSSDINRSLMNDTASSSMASKLNSIDSNKRLGALIMLNGLLMQNQTRPVALDKLTCPETLSALSVRLLDACSEVVQQTLLCLTTMARIGRKFVEKLCSLGIDSTVVRLLSESMLLLSSPVGNVPQSTLLNIILELVKIMYVSSAIFVQNKRVAITSLILQHSSKLLEHIAVAEFVHELTLADNGSLCQAFYVGELHLYLKSVSFYTSVEAKQADSLSVHAGYHNAVLTATMFCILNSANNKLDETTSLMLSRLIGWVRLSDAWSSSSSSLTSMLVDAAVDGMSSPRPTDGAERAVSIKMCTATSKTIMKLYQKLLLVGRKRGDAGPVGDDVKGDAEEFLLECAEKYFSNCVGSALAAIRAATDEIQVHGHSSDEADGSLAPLFEVCEAIMEDISRFCSWVSADDPPPPLLVTFEVPVVVDFVQRLIAIISLLSDMDDTLRAAAAASCGEEDEAECDEGDEEMRERRRTSLQENRESLSCSLESALECLSAIVQLTAVDALCTALGSDDLQQKLSLLLCRCSSSCFGSVAVSSVMLVGLLAQRDGQYREQHMSANGSRMIQPRINALLSNALLRVIDTASTSAPTAVEGYEKLGIVDAAMSAIIDLHTADDPELLQNFVRLNALKKLGDCVLYFQTALHAAEGQPNRDPERMVDGDEEEDSDGDSADRKEMFSDFNDTISNVRSFIEYKSLYCKNC